MPTLPTNPHSIGDSGHVNDHNSIVSALEYTNTYQAGNKNRIINGNFMVNQRSYTSGSNLASGTYGFDRWKSGYTNTSLTFTSAPQGQSVTISTSGVIQQIIERANIPAAYYTLSWSGTATGRVYNSGAGAPSYAASPITISLDGTANVVVEFTASGGTKTLSNVQLEAGTSATPFEFEPIETTTRKCQRYYYQHLRGTPKFIGVGAAASATSVYIGVQFPVTMRTSATLSAASGTDYYNFDRNGASDLFNSFTISVASDTGAFIYNASEVSGTIGQAGVVYSNNASSAVGFSAEL